MKTVRNRQVNEMFDFNDIVSFNETFSDRGKLSDEQNILSHDIAIFKRTFLPSHDYNCDKQVVLRSMESPAKCNIRP